MLYFDHKYFTDPLKLNLLITAVKSNSNYNFQCFQLAFTHDSSGKNDVMNICLCFKT